MIFNHRHDITCDHHRSHHHGTHDDDVMIILMIILKYTHHRAKFFIRVTEYITQLSLDNEKCSSQISLSRHTKATYYYFEAF